MYVRPRSPLRWAGLTAATAAGVWLSYTAVFAACGAGAVLLWLVIRRRAPRLLVPLAILTAVAGGSLAGMYLSYGQKNAQATSGYRRAGQWTRGFPPLGQPAKLPWWLLRTHTGNLLAYPVGGRNFGSTATFVFVIAGIVTLCRKKRGALLVLLLTPVAANFAAAGLHRYPYGISARTSQYAAPAVCVLAGAGLAGALELFLRGKHLKRGVFIAAGVFTVVAVVGIVRDVARPYKTLCILNSRRTARAFAERHRPGDLWAVFLAPRPGLGPPADPRAPDIRIYRGAAAAFRIHLWRFLPPEAVLWAPPPEHVAAAARESGGRVRLVFYRDLKRADEAPGLEQHLADYLGALSARLGPAGEPEHIRIWSPEDPDRTEREEVDVYTFEGAGPGRGR